MYKLDRLLLGNKIWQLQAVISIGVDYPTFTNKNSIQIPKVFEELKIVYSYSLDTTVEAYTSFHKTSTIKINDVFAEEMQIICDEIDDEYFYFHAITNNNKYLDNSISIYGRF